MPVALPTVRRSFGILEAVSTAKTPTPFLKWAGGKTQLLPQVSRYFPPSYDRYLEPFLGGGAVFFRLLPRKAILSDSNSELINAFEIVRDDPEGLMKALDYHYPHRKSRDCYNRLRALDPGTLSPVERAARTVYLNKTCFNGLYRVNSKGQFNVPFGRYSNPSLYNRENLVAASAALQGVELTAADYHKVSRRAKKGDFIYFDPPYYPLSPTSSFTGYTKNSFREEDQVQLAKTFRTLDERGCMVMLSNSSAELIRELYSGYTIITLKAARAISCKGEGRGKIDEVLILNYL